MCNFFVGFQFGPGSPTVRAVFPPVVLFCILAILFATFALHQPNSDKHFLNMDGTINAHFHIITWCSLNCMHIDSPDCQHVVVCQFAAFVCTSAELESDHTCARPHHHLVS
jgi:hypothetical protein